MSDTDTATNQIVLDILFEKQQVNKHKTWSYPTLNGLCNFYDNCTALL